MEKWQTGWQGQAHILGWVFGCGDMEIGEAGPMIGPMIASYSTQYVSNLQLLIKFYK